MSERMSAVFHGNVQGVGFRYNTRDVAGRFAVKGTVRNCPDGTVELIAEGDRKELMAFVSAVRERFASNIDQVMLDWGPASGEYLSFQIHH